MDWHCYRQTNTHHRAKRVRHLLDNSILMTNESVCQYVDLCPGVSQYCSLCCSCAPPSPGLSADKLTREHRKFGTLTHIYCTRLYHHNTHHSLLEAPEQCTDATMSTESTECSDILWCVLWWYNLVQYIWVSVPNFLCSLVSLSAERPGEGGAQLQQRLQYWETPGHRSTYWQTDSFVINIELSSRWRTLLALWWVLVCL
jgi:hypothetical protein